MADDNLLDRDESLPPEAAMTSDESPADGVGPVVDSPGADPSGMSVEGEPVPSGEDKHGEDNEAQVGADAPVTSGEKKVKAASKRKAVEPVPESTPVTDEPVMNWFVLKVQVNREDSIRDALARRIAMAGLDAYFGKILVPSEKVTEVRGGRKRTVRRKLLPGYLIIEMAITDETWFLVRETTGVGDFTGAGGHPTPMEPHEVQRLLATEQDVEKKEAKIKIGFSVGDRVKVNEGTFENFEGEVHAIDDTNGVVWVMINIFGRSTPVRFEYWQIEAAS